MIFNSNRYESLKAHQTEQQNAPSTAPSSPLIIFSPTNSTTSSPPLSPSLTPSPTYRPPFRYPTELPTTPSYTKSTQRSFQAWPLITAGTSRLIRTLPSTSVLHDPTLSITPQNTRMISSYDLLPKSGHETRGGIVVPGYPPIFNPPTFSPTTPITIPNDTGFHLHHPVTSIFTRSPLEPIFRSASIMAPTFPLHTCTVITDRRNLRDLLDFLESGIKLSRQFRIDTELVNGKMLLLTNNTAHFPGARKKPGQFGLEFQKAVTERKGMEMGLEAVYHNRVVYYEFAGEKMCVRYKVDAVKPEFVGDMPKGFGENMTSMPTAPAGRIKSDLAGRRWSGSSKVNGSWRSKADSSVQAAEEEKGKPTTLTPGQHKIVYAGQLGRAPGVVDITTLAKGSLHDGFGHRNIKSTWLARVPILALGRHIDGQFEELEVRNLEENGSWKEWEEEEAEALQKLARVLGIIRETMVESGKNKLAVIKRKGEDTLEFYTLDEKGKASSLPWDIRKSLKKPEYRAKYSNI